MRENLPKVLLPQDILSFFKKHRNKKAITQINVDSNFHYSITFDELQEIISEGAYFFKKILSLPQGSTVSYLLENSPEVMIINLVCFFSGFRACPLDVKRETETTASYKLKETNSTVLFFRNSPVFKEFADKIIKNNPIKTYSLDNVSSLKKLFGSKNLSSYDTFNPDDPCLILYTSGTTGMPKGALLSFSNLFYGSYQVGKWFDIKNEDVFHVVLPMHHINSTVFSLATLLAGGSLLVASRYSRSRFFSDLAKFKATMSSIVPTINIDLLEQEEEYKKVASRLKVKRIQIGSAPVSAAHTTQFVKKYKIPLVQGYGSTETSLRVTGVPTDVSKKIYEKLLSKNSIGEALSANEVILIDEKAQEVGKAGTVGELCVRGKNVMKGYLNRDKDTQEVMENGYFHTGDIGYFEQMGKRKMYYLVGRKKEIIIKGGVNVSPLYIEEQMRVYVPWARDVVVVGFPHYRLGEEIGVIVIPKQDGGKKNLEKLNQDLNAHLIPNLSPFETPKVAILATDPEIAKTATGKVQHIKVEHDFEQRLLDAYSYIGENSRYIFRLITPSDENLFDEIIRVHNAAFLPGMQLTKEKLLHRIINGFVLGAFKKGGSLEGILTGFFTDREIITKGKNWIEITADGTFENSRPRGDSGLLISVASIHAGRNINIKTIPRVDLTKEILDRYLKSGKDYVARFHQKPKAGFKTGAKVERYILNGNPKDYESLGTIVVFAYPSLNTLQKITFTDDSIGIGLVEAAIKLAKDRGKKGVFALSRFGEAYKHLVKK